MNWETQILKYTKGKYYEAAQGYVLGYPITKEKFENCLKDFSFIKSSDMKEKIKIKTDDINNKWLFHSKNYGIDVAYYWHTENFQLTFYEKSSFYFNEPIELFDTTFQKNTPLERYFILDTLAIPVKPRFSHPRGAMYRHDMGEWIWDVFYECPVPGKIDIDVDIYDSVLNIRIAGKLQIELFSPEPSFFINESKKKKEKDNIEDVSIFWLEKVKWEPLL